MYKAILRNSNAFLCVVSLMYTLQFDTKSRKISNTVLVSTLSATTKINKLFR